jgi:hypothetical protein
MPATALRIAESLTLVFDALAFKTAFLYRFPEHPVMPFEAIHIFGRLQKESEQIEETG